MGPILHLHIILRYAALAPAPAAAPTAVIAENCVRLENTNVKSFVRSSSFSHTNELCLRCLARFPFPNLEQRQVRFNSKGIGFEANNINSNVVTWGKAQPIHHDNMGDCRTYLATTLSGETRTILGFPAVHAVEHSEIWDYETWLAPALDCMVVEKTVHWKKDHMNPDAGAYDGITTEVATSLAATPPDDSLFALPDNAVELTPSQYLIAIGQPADPKRDAAYERDKQLRTRP